MCTARQPCHPCAMNSGYCCASAGYNIYVVNLHVEVAHANLGGNKGWEHSTCP
jgi:hypothetical protein